MNEMSLCVLHYGDLIMGFDTWDDLRTWLDAPETHFGCDSPLLDLIHRSGGNILTVGLSPDGGTLDFSRPSLVLPFLTSLGDDDSDDLRLFSLSDGETTEIPLRNCITREQTMIAVRHFFETGNQPQNVRWEES